MSICTPRAHPCYQPMSKLRQPQCSFSLIPDETRYAYPGVMWRYQPSHHTGQKKNLHREVQAGTPIARFRPLVKERGPQSSGGALTAVCQSEEIFGWMKTVGGFRRTRYRGVERTGLAGYFVATAYNLVRMANLLLRQETRAVQSV